MVCLRALGGTSSLGSKMKEATVMHAGTDIQKLASDQTTARGHKSVEDLLMLTDSAEDTAAGSRDTRREEQSKGRHASGNQKRNANTDITVDTEGTGDRQERLQDLKQDRAERQERADKNLEGAERQASEDRGGRSSERGSGLPHVTWLPCCIFPEGSVGLHLTLWRKGEVYSLSDCLEGGFTAHQCPGIGPL